MNIQLIVTVLTLLGDLPSMPSHEVSRMPPAVYASWVEQGSVTYRCPDAASGIDPMGETVVVAKTMKDTDGTNLTLAKTVTLYPESKMCSRETRQAYHDILASPAEAAAFKAKLAPETTHDWMTRDATEQEVADYALERRQWKVHHYPGGDMFSYPTGVYEIYPQADLRMEHPIGSGNSELAAVADALRRA